MKVRGSRALGPIREGMTTFPELGLRMDNVPKICSNCSEILVAGTSYAVPMGLHGERHFFCTPCWGLEPKIRGFILDRTQGGKITEDLLSELFDIGISPILTETIRQMMLLEGNLSERTEQSK